MSNCKNGQTYVNTCIAAQGATDTDATYVLNLTHYTCGNRQICANGAYPITADLKYRIIGTPESVGNGVYNCSVLCTGTVTYMPYKSNGNNCGCGCQSCPITENVWATVSVPIASAEIPDITDGDSIAEATELKDCCNLTNAVSITSSFNLASTQG